MRLFKGIGLMARRNTVTMNTRAYNVQRFATPTKPRTSFRHALLLGSLGLSILAVANIGYVNAADNAKCDARHAPDDAELDLVRLDGEHEERIKVSSRASRISCATYKANFPIEDKFDVQQSSKNGGVYALVLDGHGGWQVSEYGKQVLIDNVRKEVEQLKAKSQHHEVEVNRQDGGVSSVKTPNTPTKDQIAGAIQRGFTRTDRELMGKVFDAFKLGFGAVARCGSCALLVYVDGNMLHVANAGDIRAVLGKQTSEDTNYVAVPLSSDQNAMSKIEQERLKKEHPGEDNVYVCRHPDSCYVKSALQPTRALGDFALKYSEFNGPPYVNGDRSAGRHISQPYTPPYISAVPEIRTHELSSDDKFVIIGSDGVWDFLSNEEAVNTVREQLANGTPDQAAQAVVKRTLQTAASQYGLSLSDLLGLPPGSHRRRIHDDTTAVVVFFD